MALLSKGGQVVYYAHPRKTGGTSFIEMAKKAGWKVEWWYDPRRVIDQPTHWAATDYLPILDRDLRRVDYVLLTVRHPLRRMGSLYRYSSKLAPRRGETMPSYDWWINLLMDVNDIRITPQAQYLPRTADPDVTLLTQIVRFEDTPRGTAPPAYYLRSIDPAARVPAVRREAGTVMPSLRLPTSTRNRLIDYMAADFTTFRYDPDKAA